MRKYVDWGSCYLKILKVEVDNIVLDLYIFFYYIKKLIFVCKLFGVYWSFCGVNMDNRNLLYCIFLVNGLIVEKIK